jgi:hypothetical protein
MKHHDLEILITTRKFFACEAETIEEAVKIATTEARKHLGQDFYSLEIRDPSAGWPQTLHEARKPDIS